MNTQEIRTALKARYDQRSFALLWEVGNSTGANCRRHADALAMSLWPSRGLVMIGHEIKASRSDWVKELQDPGKAEPIFQFCDRWYLVAGDKEIVKAGELPATWGLMVPRGAGLVVSVEAPALEPKPYTKGFMAACLRRVNDQGAEQMDLKKSWQSGHDVALKAGELANKYNLEKLGELRGRVRKFEQASGIAIGDTWSFQGPEAIGAAVRLVLRGGHKETAREMQKLRAIAKRVLEVTEGVDDEADAEATYSGR